MVNERPVPVRAATVPGSSPTGSADTAAAASAARANQYAQGAGEDGDTADRTAEAKIKARITVYRSASGDAFQAKLSTEYGGRARTRNHPTPDDALAAMHAKIKREGKSKQFDITETVFDGCVMDRTAEAPGLTDGVYVVNLATDRAGQCAWCAEDDPPRAFYIVCTDADSNCVCATHLEAAMRDGARRP